MKGTVGKRSTATPKRVTTFIYENGKRKNFVKEYISKVNAIGDNGADIFQMPGDTS